MSGRARRAGVVAPRRSVASSPTPSESSEDGNAISGLRIFGMALGLFAVGFLALFRYSVGLVHTPAKEWADTWMGRYWYQALDMMFVSTVGTEQAVELQAQLQAQTVQINAVFAAVSERQNDVQLTPEMVRAIQTAYILLCAAENEALPFGALYIVLKNIRSPEVLSILQNPQKIMNAVPNSVATQAAGYVVANGFRDFFAGFLPGLNAQRQQQNVSVQASVHLDTTLAEEAQSFFGFRRP